MHIYSFIKRIIKQNIRDREYDVKNELIVPGRSVNKLTTWNPKEQHLRKTHLYDSKAHFTVTYSKRN